MNRLSKFAVVMLGVLAIGFLVGDDCDIDVDGWGPWCDGCYDGYYEPVPVVPVYPDPFFFW